MIGAISLAKVGLAASILFSTIAATTNSASSRTTNKRFMAFLLRRLSVAFTCRLWLRSSEILFVYRVVKITDHHLVPGLLPPLNQLRRIGIELVLWRIVEVRDAFQAAALRRGHFLLKNISQLPIEIPARHREQHLRCAVGVNQCVEKILAAKVHVRVKAVNVAVFFKGERRCDFVVRNAGRNFQTASNRASRDYALLNRMF